MSDAELLEEPQAKAAEDVAIDCKVDKIFYGKFLAVRDSNRSDREGQDHRFYRTVRLRQEHRPAQPQPDE